LLVSLLSFAYPNVDGATRAELTRRLLVGAVPQGAFVLSTCLRTEVVVLGDPDRLRGALEQLFSGPVDVEQGFMLAGEDAVRHIFRVAAGLESPILGETEILTQFRQSVIAAEQDGLVEGLFAKLLETAVSTGRQARELIPGSPHDSMAAVAAQVVGGHERVAVFGSGTMSTAVVFGLQNLPAPPDVVVVARRPEKVTLEGVDVWSFDRAVDVLTEFPAVVSATSAKHRPVADEDMRRALRARDAPLVLVDMAMPPDFVAPDGALVEYVDIDMLARMADRRPRSEGADAMVSAAAADAYRSIADHHAVGPVIGGMTASADDLVDQIVERFAGKLAEEGDRPVLRQATHTAVRTLLAHPITYLRSGDRPEEAVDIIAEAFGIEDD